MTRLVVLGFCSLQNVFAVKQKNDFREILEVSLSGYQHTASCAHQLKLSKHDSYGSSQGEASVIIATPKEKKAAEDVYFAALADKAELYDDMTSYMKQALVKAPTSFQRPDRLSVEWPLLLSKAYKNAVGRHRNAWRTIKDAEVKEESNGHKEIAGHLKQYRGKVEIELQHICDTILGLLNHDFIGQVESDELKVFYHRMRGDYYRYIAEFAEGGNKENAQRDAGSAYTDAQTAAQGLPVYHQERLSLELNLCVFYYEVLRKRQEALDMAKEAINAVETITGELADLETIPMEYREDAVKILGLLIDNEQQWESERAEGLWD